MKQNCSNAWYFLLQVIIDNVNIKDLNLQAARRSMAVITQDPVLFSGSLRRNLDPFSLYEDHDMWSALEEVQLKTEGGGGGDSIVFHYCDVI